VSNFRKRLLAMISAFDHLAPQVIGKLQATPHLHAASLGALAAFARAGVD
jgi:hypothetical protein